MVLSQKRKYAQAWHKEKTMKKNIYAVPEEGYWVLLDEEGDYVQDGFAYRTEAEAIEACEYLWPTNSMWKGRRPAWCIDLYTPAEP